MNVLDTDHLSLLERADSPERQRLQARLDASGEAPPTATIISYEEQVRGWLSYLARARSLQVQIDGYQRLLRQHRHYCSLRILHFDEQAAVEFQRLRKSRLRLATMDLKIAAITLVRGATLLTRNMGDFGKVPGLQVDDWTKE